VQNDFKAGYDDMISFRVPSSKKREFASAAREEGSTPGVLLRKFLYDFIKQNKQTKTCKQSNCEAA